MFEELSNKLEVALKAIKGQNKITEENIASALSLVRRALIDADVNLDVANQFINNIKHDAIGIEVVKGITPGQKFIDIVHKKLVEIMGEYNEALIFNSVPSTILLVGLQGAGKTTAAAKLGLHLKLKGKKVLLIAADTFRPAAKEQLKTLGQQIGVDVFVGEIDQTSMQIAIDGSEYARKENIDVIIVDTAGRLYIDDGLMEEIVRVKEALRPDEVLLVVDAMIGQEAAELAKVFNDRVKITGSILTKMDGDSRGGAALSIRKVSGSGIKFIGTGEKVEALEAFYPERLAGRILGMGDVLTLVEKAQKEMEMDDVLSMQKKFEEASFDFTDFLKQMRMIKRMGSISSIIKLIPGMQKINESTIKSGEEQLKRVQTIINSMTEEEKNNPSMLVQSQKRRRRVAFGSGHSLAEVEKMIKDFERMRGMMQSLVRGDLSGIQSRLGGSAGMSKPNKTTNNSKSTVKGPHLKRDTKRKKGFFDL